MGVKFQSKIYEKKQQAGNLTYDIVKNNTSYDKTVLIEYFGTGTFSYANNGTQFFELPFIFKLVVTNNSNSILKYINCNTSNTTLKINQRIVLKRNQKIRLVTDALGSTQVGFVIVQYQEEIIS